MSLLSSEQARRAEVIVVSYNCAVLADDRAGYGWVNALTSEAILELLQQVGDRPDTVQLFGGMEFSGASFGPLRRFRRRIARVSYTRP